MKSAHATSAIMIAVLMLLMTGCKANDAASDTASKSTPPAVSNANSTNKPPQPIPTPDSNRNGDATRTSAAPDSTKPKSKGELLGTYESREVESNGVVTVISKLKTTWLFSANGNYSRVSEVNGKTYHADSGTFRIEAPDNLVLTIQTTGQKAKRKMQIPTVEKVHKFTLSSDGDELKLISDKGSIGIFRRVAKPNPTS